MDDLRNTISSVGAGAGNQHHNGRFNSRLARGCHCDGTRQRHFRAKSLVMGLNEEGELTGIEINKLFKNSL